MMRPVALMIVLLAATSPTRPALAAPAQPLPLLAVLELEAPEQELPGPELLLLTDALRGAVVQEVGARYKVLTRETMMELVPPEQMKCFVDKCAAEIGRMLQAPYVVAGNIRKLGKSLVVTIEAYETNGGRLLGSKQLRAGDAEELFGRIETEGPTFVRSWLNAKPVQAPVETGRVGTTEEFNVRSAEQVVVAFESTPTGAVVMVNGELACRATPCQKALPMGSHQVAMSMEQYEATTRTVTVSKTARKVAMELPSTTQTVEVVTDPTDLPITLDGKPVGTAPLRLKVPFGAHQVLVKDGCWQELGERFVAERGPARTLKIAVVPRWAGLKVMASDQDGNDLEAAVEVDGKAMGQTPLTAKVPLCSKSLRVSLNGVVEDGELSLKEREVGEVRLRLAMPKKRPPVMQAEPGSVQGELEAQLARIPRKTAPRPSWAIRAGMSGQSGFLGVSVEWRPRWWGVVLGTGYMPFSAGVTFGSPDNKGGFYADLFGMWVGQSVFVKPEKSGMAYGGSAGWDWRVDGWTIKTGVGVGGTTLGLKGQSPGSVDVTLGRVW